MNTFATFCPEYSRFGAQTAAPRGGRTRPFRATGRV